MMTDQQGEIQIMLLLQNQNCQQNQIQLFTTSMNNSDSDLHGQSLLSQDNASTNAQVDQNQFELTPLEKLIDKVGGEHSYQLKSFMIFNLMWFLTSWMLVGQGFFFDESYECIGINNKQQCEKFICSLEQNQIPHHLKSHAKSIVFEFESNYFICKNSYLKPVLQSLLYFGSLLGFFVIPYIADNWGRRIAMRISWTFFVIGILFNLLADSPNMVGMGQLLTGFGCNPAITLCYSFLNEQVLRKKRQYYGLFIQVSLAIGQCTIAFMFIPDYSFKVVLYILLGLVVVNWFLLAYLLQTPKFTISKSKKQTLQILNQMAKRNNRQPITSQQVQQISTVNQEEVEGTSIIDLFKYPSLRWATIAGGFVFMAIQVIYYGTTLNLDHIGYSKLVNQLIVGLSQGVGYMGAEIVISRIFRKKWSLIGMGLSSVMCFVLSIMTIVQNDSNADVMKVLETIALILNRFVLCAFWGLFYVYVAEMYPTKVRSMGFGWTSAMGTVGSTLAPYMIFYSKQAGINSWIPPGVFGAIGFFSIFCLKQTFKKPMYDDIEEVRLKGKWDLSDDQDETTGPQNTDDENEKQKSIKITINDT